MADAPPLLVFGAGWLGRGLVARWPGAVLARADIADAAAVARALDEHRPRRVVNAAGRTGHPNVDALEDDPAGTWRSNVAGPILLAAACRERGIHFTHLGSGCLYQGDNAGRGFAEDDPPNYAGSLYSRTKAAAEAPLADLGALQLRLRMPLASEPHPRNLLTKLLGFEEVVRVANSITVLDDFWAPARVLIEREATGVFHLVNEGVEYHDEVLHLWRRLADSGHRFRVIPPEALAARTRAGRSHCVLSTAKARAHGVGLPPLTESLPRVLAAYRDRARPAPPGHAPAGGGSRRT